MLKHFDESQIFEAIIPNESAEIRKLHDIDSDKLGNKLEKVVGKVLAESKERGDTNYREVYETLLSSLVEFKKNNPKTHDIGNWIQGNLERMGVLGLSDINSLTNTIIHDDHPLKNEDLELRKEIAQRINGSRSVVSYIRKEQLESPKRRLCVNSVLDKKYAVDLVEIDLSDREGDNFIDTIYLTQVKTSKPNQETILEIQNKHSEYLKWMRDNDELFEKEEEEQERKYEEMAAEIQEESADIIFELEVLLDGNTDDETPELYERFVSMVAEKETQNIENKKKRKLGKEKIENNIWLHLLDIYNNEKSSIEKYPELVGILSYTKKEKYDYHKKYVIRPNRCRRIVSRIISNGGGDFLLEKKLS